jgi:glucarate dehydratase
MIIQSSIDFPSSPKVTEMQVVPVAGHDDMLLNLSGAHAPFFTRNVVILRDNAGHTGVGEVPGGEQIRQRRSVNLPRSACDGIERASGSD